MFSQYDFRCAKTGERLAVLATLTALILFGTHNKIFSLAAFVVAALVLVYAVSAFKLMMMTYLMLTAHVFTISAGGMSYFTFLMFLYLGLELLQKRRILWSSLFFALYVLVVQLSNGFVSMTNDLKLIGNILFIGYALTQIETFSKKERSNLCIAYVGAVIITSLMRFLDSDFFRISAYTNALKSESFGSGSSDIVRFSGLYQDPNYYSVNLVIALCLTVILYYQGSLPAIVCAFSGAALVYLGTLTYSKSFLLMLWLPLALLFYANRKLGRTTAQIVSLAIVAAAAAYLLLGGGGYLNALLRRLQTGSSLTTGRSDIWAEYLYYIYRNPLVAFFGVGVGADILSSHAVHNVYLEIFYHLGLIGGVSLILVIVQSGLMFRRRNRKNFLNYSLLICVLMMYAWLSQLHDYEFPLHFMLAYMVLFLWDGDVPERAASPAVCLPLLPDTGDGEMRLLAFSKEE